MRVAGLRGGVILARFVGMMGRLPVVKVVVLLTGWKNVLIFPLHYLYLKKFTQSGEPATRSARLRFFFLPREFIDKSRVKLRILTQKIIFRAAGLAGSRLRRRLRPPEAGLVAKNAGF